MSEKPCAHSPPTYQVCREIKGVQRVINDLKEGKNQAEVTAKLQELLDERVALAEEQLDATRAAGNRRSRRLNAMMVLVMVLFIMHWTKIRQLLDDLGGPAAGTLIAATIGWLGLELFNVRLPWHKGDREP